MPKNIVIVESPAKAKTIEKFLGKDYVVKSSFGHIRDLVKKNFGIDIENNFAPIYEVMPDKKKIVAELNKEIKTADLVLLASDEDREGEAIAWHLYEVLKLKNKNTKRIVFNEITKEAIVAAVKNPRDIDLNLVNAQQARRVLDRLVGFELSSVLWKKVKASLSAGRVQSVAVRLIVDREREIINFKPEVFFKVYAVFSITQENGEVKEFKAELSDKFLTQEEVISFYEKHADSEYIVSESETKPGKKSPSPPFTTSSLQQEASRKLGFPVAKTMRVAQNLYESGFITYMRTDSLNLSDTALKSAENVITSEFGDKYYKKRVFKTKTKGAQEAHEAIRPTDFKKENIEGTYDERKLYDLIRKRAMASQMSDAVFEKTNVKIDISKSKYFYSASGEVLIFDGFLKVYNNSEEDEEKKVFLPTIKVGQKPELKISEAIQKYTKHSARYTEAALVKKMEELGIGRPSTYAPTISTIQNRGYVLKEDREGTVRKFKIITFSPDKKINVSENKETIGTEKSKLFPTDIGMVVTDFLAENFTEIIDYNFTANVENEFDIISLGKLEWQKMIKDFYEKFHKQVEDTIKFSERNTGERILGIDQETGNEISVRLGRFGPVVQSQKIGSEDKPQFASLNKGQHIETISLDEALGLLKNSFSGRLLGQDPETGKNIYTRIARYGAIAQIGENDDAEKPRFAPLLSGMTIENITLEQAVELFRLPRYIGDYQEKNITIAVGKFGPYVKFGNLFASLKKDDNPLTIKLERAVELIKEKIQKDKDRLIKDFPENDKVIIIKDRWGRPCIFFNKKYFNIADIKNPETLTLEKCMEIIDKTIGKEQKKTGKTKKK